MKHITIYFPSGCIGLCHDDRITLSELCTKGETLEDILANLEIYAEDWHGNPVDIGLDDLVAADYDYVVQQIAEQLAGV